MKVLAGSMCEAQGPSWDSAGSFSDPSDAETEAVGLVGSSMACITGLASSLIQVSQT